MGTGTLARALREAGRHRLRSALTLLALVLAVGAVVASLSLVRAAGRMGLARIAREGALDAVRVGSPEAVWRDGRRQPLERRVLLGEADAAALGALVPDLRAALPRVELAGDFRRGSVSFQAPVVGSEAGALALDSRELVRGRVFDRDEAERGAQVALLSLTLAADLFGSGEPLEQEVLLAGKRFRVVGLLRTRVDWLAGEEERVAYVPFRTALRRLGAAPGEVHVVLAAASVERVGETAEAARALLPRLRPEARAESFEVETSEEDLEELATEQGLQRLLLGGVALLTVLAAGSGVLNTLLVSVRERTREIGTRRALGARRAAVRSELVLEALVLALPGAAAGLALGLAVARSLAAHLATQADLPQVAVSLSAGEAAAAAAAAVAITLVTGLVAGARAAALDPAEALRWE